MTKNEAVKEFKEAYAEYIEKNKDDKIALNLAWHIYVDSLCKDGQITQKQYSSWDNIF